MQEISKSIIKQKYLAPDETSFEERLDVIANEVASVNTKKKSKQGSALFKKYRDLLERFSPGGRIIQNCGRNLKKTTMINCTGLNKIPDSMTGIMSSMSNLAILLQAGAGVGCNFSSLRPKNDIVKGIGGLSSGPVSFMHVANSICKTIESSGRRGALMSILFVSHPDIEEFITCKDKRGVLSQFNISVGITEGFMNAVKKDEDWELFFINENTNEKVLYKTIRARYLWELILKHSYKYSEPGVVFLDNANRLNTLYFGEEITLVNPWTASCGFKSV